MDHLLNITPEEIRQAIHDLQECYPDAKVDNHKIIIGTVKPIPINEQEIRQYSFKSSYFEKVLFNQCTIENNSYTGSFLKEVTFQDTALTGNGFISCDFYKTSFRNCAKNECIANNYSNSNFTHCNFENIYFKSTGMLHCLFNKCILSDCIIQSSTMEGTVFENCFINQTDMSNVNVDYVCFVNSCFQKVSFPFYQFAYIIGSADIIQKSGATVFLKAGNSIIYIDEYKKQIQNLICYYYEKEAYFPICNLYIALNNRTLAQDCLSAGIYQALDQHDFRLIQYFCKLGKRYQLFNESMIQKLLNDIDYYLMEGKLPEENLNTYLIHAGEIRTTLLGQSSNQVALELNIKTIIQKDNTEGLEYVHNLVQKINQMLSKTNLPDGGYQIGVCSHSPFEIAILVIGCIADITLISKNIWDMTAGVRNRKKNEKRTEQLDNKIINIELQKSKAYRDTKIEQYKKEILSIKEQYYNQDMNDYIEEITQRLKADLDELYSRDISIFKIQNKKHKLKC